MKELKTLKDLDTFDKFMPCTDKRDFIDKDELKAEAIKWIKWFKDSDWDEFKEFNSSDEFGSGHEGLDNWIRHFFNLTEEELSK